MTTKKNNSGNRLKDRDLQAKSRVDFRLLSHKILDYANKVSPRVEFLNEILKILLDFAACDAIELWLKKPEKYVLCKIASQERHTFIHKPIPATNLNGTGLIPNIEKQSYLDNLRENVLTGRIDQGNQNYTPYGSLRIADLNDYNSPGVDLSGENRLAQYADKADFRSLAMIPLILGNEIIGLIQFISYKAEYFSEHWVKSLEDIAGIIAIAIVNQRSQAALEERVKELTCLYSIARLVENENLSNSEIFQAIVNLIPPAWQYPEITASKITLDDNSFSTANFDSGRQKQSTDIIVKSVKRGRVEVVYTTMMPTIDEGPFLKEERSLLEVIARQIELILARREAKEESSKLQEQLKHTDRLATIGQLAAGVAHELNEPLGGILGFAQLVKKSGDLPEQAHSDVDKIVSAAIHAREVIKKLMLFARQMPPAFAKFQLNGIINDSLYFYKARCAKAGIVLDCDLASGLPEITGDPSQLSQVLINLVVNSIQAMPAGGKLTIKTSVDDNDVCLSVSDTGIGMSDDIMQKVFVPFFTTKNLDEGTGLGLAVVHGIVTAHKGIITVKSEVGKGATFEVRFPLA